MEVPPLCCCRRLARAVVVSAILRPFLAASVVPLLSLCCSCPFDGVVGFLSCVVLFWLLPPSVAHRRLHTSTDALGHGTSVSSSVTEDRRLENFKAGQKVLDAKRRALEDDDRRRREAEELKRAVHIACGGPLTLRWR